MLMNRKTRQPKGAVEKIRQFRTDYYKSYIKRHKKFDIHQFTAEFLNRRTGKK